MKHLDITIHGKVQGVFFRANAKEVADNFSISGFVMNQDDGTVRIEAEGDDQSLEEYLVWCRKGPVRAEVSKVEFSSGELKNFRSFEIRR